MSPRYLIVIPVYNHPKTLNWVIKNCLQETEIPILIVDDGSSPKVSEIIDTSLIADSARVNLIEHSENKGKGAALQSAFKWALENNFTHVISIDADGQHFPSDIPNLVKRSQLFPWSLILGDREMTGSNIPESSKFGKKFSNFWVKFETEHSVGDSQSGFRIYPLFALQNTKFFSQHYDFEIEVITRLIWTRVDVQNVKIQVKYDPPSVRVTHFDKWKDNIRLTILNSLLVTHSLFQRTEKPLLNSLALGVGVLIGTTPLYGLHTLIVIGLALLTRMNLALLWIGTHISFPPFIPLLILGTKAIHNLLFHSGVASNQKFETLLIGSQWFLSSMILGSILGLVIGLLTYFLQMRQRASVKPKQKVLKGEKVKNNIPLGIWILQMILKKMGLRVANSFLYFIVPFYMFNLRVRHSTNEYWKTLQPKIGFWTRQIKMYRQLLNFAQSLLERTYLQQVKGKELQFIKDSTLLEVIELIDKEKNRPFVFVSSHFGGWELAMTIFNSVGIKKRMLIVMQQGDNEHDYHSTSLNQRENFEILYFNNSTFPILKIREYLNRGDMVGLMGDRPVSESYELISLFNKLCLLDSTPFRLSSLLNTELIYLFCVKESTLNYRICAERSIENINIHSEDITNEQKGKILLNSMKEYAQVLEKYISKNPEQWMNFFPFFSRKPQK